MKTNTGDFIKAIGADWGAYWNGKRWVRFECFGCAYAQGLLKNRLQNGGRRIKIGPANNDVLHDVQIHNEWLRNGKPKP